MRPRGSSGEGTPKDRETSGNDRSEISDHMNRNDAGRHTKASPSARGVRRRPSLLGGRCLSAWRRDSSPHPAIRQSLSVLVTRHGCVCCIQFYTISGDRCTQPPPHVGSQAPCCKYVVDTRVVAVVEMRGPASAPRRRAPAPRLRQGPLRPRLSRQAKYPGRSLFSRASAGPAGAAPLVPRWRARLLGKWSRSRRMRHEPLHDQAADERRELRRLDGPVEPSELPCVRSTARPRTTRGPSCSSTGVTARRRSSSSWTRRGSRRRPSRASACSAASRWAPRRVAA
jgi:hypothetical protein